MLVEMIFVMAQSCHLFNNKIMVEIYIADSVVKEQYLPGAKSKQEE